MHSEFESKKMNIEEIKKKISEKYVNYDHFADSKSSIEQKYDNQFILEKVNLKPKNLLATLGVILHFILLAFQEQNIKLRLL